MPEGIAYADPFMELSYGYGCIAAGSKLIVVVAPTNVSFSNVIIMEEECEVSYAGGWFASGNRSQRYTHTPAFGANNPVKLVFSKDLNGYYFGDIVEVDTEAWYDRTGLMHWHIPVNWWVDRIGRNNKHPFNEGFFLMEFTVLLDNTAIVEKFNTKTIRSTNGQTERYDSNGQKKTD